MSQPKPTNPKVIGYLRVSTEQQELDNQRLELLDYAHRHNLKIHQFIQAEVSSRKTTAERKIDLLLETLKEGDLLLVSELSRLGRSVGQIIQIIDGLIKNKIKFVAIKERIKVDGKQDIQTKTMITLMGLFAEIERDLISQRTKQGLKAAKNKGKIIGRPKGTGKSKLDASKLEIEILLKNGSSKTFVAKRYHTSLPNFYKWLKKQEVES